MTMVDAPVVEAVAGSTRSVRRWLFRGVAGGLLAAVVAAIFVVNFDIRGLPLHVAAVCATTTQPAVDGRDYEPMNLVDGDVQSDWNHFGSSPNGIADPGNATGGVGEKLRFYFDDPTSIGAIRMLNGSQDQLERYRRNNRAALIAVTVQVSGRWVEAGRWEPAATTMGHWDEFVPEVRGSITGVELRVVGIVAAVERPFGDLAVAEVEFRSRSRIRFGITGSDAVVAACAVPVG